MRGWLSLIRLALISIVLSGCFAAYDATRSDEKREPLHHRVAQGETLYGISFRYGLDYREMARWNGIASPYTIYPGQYLRLKAPNQPPRRANANKEAAEADADVIKVTPMPTAVPAVPVAIPAPAKKPAPKPTAPVKSTTASAPPASTKAVRPAVKTPMSPPDQWLWPVDGPIASSFSATDVTRHGLSLAGKEGESVRAAADGVVVYSGNGLKGYGQLIIIKHSDEYLSAYGHNKTRKVEEGAHVDAGQVIASMGLDEGKPRLHFEIRRNGKPVDPRKYLPGR